MLAATPEERKEFWKALEESMVAAGMEPGWYCPYVPIQIVGNVEVSTTKFKTRYD